MNDKINSEGNRDIEGNTITEITITPELREKYFDLAWNNRFDFIPDFPLNAPPSVARTYLEYAWLLCRMDDALIGGENGGFTTYYLDQFVFNHFKVKDIDHSPSNIGKGWDFDGKVYSPLPGSWKLATYCEVVALNERKDAENNRIIYDVFLDEYLLNEHELPGAVSDLGCFFEDEFYNKYINEASPQARHILEKYKEPIKKGLLTTNKAIRQIIIDGDTEIFREGHYFIIHLQYYIDPETKDLVYIYCENKDIH